MGRLIVTEYVTLDGVMEAPGGGEDFEHAGWTFRIDRGDDGDAYKWEETLNTAALLFGRVTYEGMAAVWPNLSGEFADRWNALPKYVVSSTLSHPTWNNTRVLRGDLTESIEALKAGVDGDVVVHGSATLVTGLLEHDLVDEIRLMTFPIVLGSGRRLFAPSDTPVKLRLTDHSVVGDGITISTYRPDFEYLVAADMPAEVNRVWRAWTEPDDYEQWFGAVPGTVELDVRPGGAWRLELAGSDPPERMSGTYLDVVPREKLVMTTSFASGDTVMEMTFHPAGESTRVEIRQRCTSRAERDGGRQGSEFLLAACQRYLEA